MSGAPDRSATRSVCPVCLRPLPAYREECGGDVVLVRTCPEHGGFRELVWEGYVDPGDWELGSAAAPDAEVPVESRPLSTGTSAHASDCPHGCADCTEHLVRPCCVLLEVTGRCNLGCPVCFAQAGAGCDADPSLQTIAGWYDTVAQRAGKANIQLSGGEPTLRDDLDRIIALGREKGFGYFQVNTNGLRIAGEPGYAQRLKEAGASCVFLQFDGLTDDVYRAMRGRPLAQVKRRAVERCAEAGLPVVLVPTVAAGVNDDQLGDIVRFAVRNAPAVRGIHVQPLARFGRVPELPGGRMTLPGVLASLEHQTDGMVSLDHFRGGSVESPFCSFSASYRIGADGRLAHIPGSRPSCCGPLHGSDGIQRAREANAARWGTDLAGLDSPAEPGSLDAFLLESRRSAFSITGMAFMDADTLDLQRLERCYIFIMGSDGALVPFCAYNLTGRGGEGPYRHPLAQGSRRTAAEGHDQDGA